MRYRNSQALLLIFAQIKILTFYAFFLLSKAPFTSALRSGDSPHLCVHTCSHQQERPHRRRAHKWDSVNERLDRLDSTLHSEMTPGLLLDLLDHSGITLQGDQDNNISHNRWSSSTWPLSRYKLFIKFENDYALCCSTHMMLNLSRMEGRREFPWQKSWWQCRQFILT